MFGDETPADPDSLGVRFGESLLEPGVVEIAHLAATLVVEIGSRTEIERLVGLTDEHRLPIRFGVERDRAEFGSVLVVVLPDRIDQAHGRFASVDDGDAVEGSAVHQFFSPIAVRSGAITPSSNGAGRPIVR